MFIGKREMATISFQLEEIFSFAFQPQKNRNRVGGGNMSREVVIMCIF